MIAIRQRCASSAVRFISSSASINKAPILYDSSTPDQESVTIQLLSWGRGASGQLGGGIEEIRIYPTPVANIVLPRASSPVPGQRLPHDLAISCGLFHSALLVEGKLWIWGKGEGGRLGFGQENAAFVPALNPNFDYVRAISLGGLHSAALDSHGQLFTWGYGGFGALGHRVYTRELLPRLVEGPWCGSIQNVATSGAHTAAITDSGELYTWGRDEGDGRLGLGPGRGPNEGGGLSIPSKVAALPVPVTSASCGGFFTMVLTEGGKIWNWGANANYELGRGDRIGGWKPQPLSALEDVCVVQIASGGYHSLALTDDGKVFSWGHGGHGQLGHSSIQNQKVPTVVEALKNKQIIYIASGGSSSAAITDTGKLYMWGNCKDSQLGVPGLPEVQTSPVEVKFLTEDDGLGVEHVLCAAIGACHAMCLVSRSSC